MAEFENAEGEPMAKRTRKEELEEVRIVPILGEVILSRMVPLIDCHVVVLKDKTSISSFVKKVPLKSAGLDHLKRVDKQGRILIKIANGEPVDDLLMTMASFGVDRTDLQVVNVPARKPLTSHQFEWAKEYWPVSFHPDKEIESLLSGTFFNEKECTVVQWWSNVAREVGCVVVQDNVEVTRGSRSNRLLGHAVMSMVQNLAEYQQDNDSEGYLATGCDVYLRDEPCAMCAMALIHCRASRVFYCNETENGVLAAGKWQLHLEPALNHHYKVFHVKTTGNGDKSHVCGSC